MECIFCFKRPPEIAFTDEHVFPSAIGGQFELSDCVCKYCNDGLGRFVDVGLADSPIVRVIRTGLHIVNRDGKSPVLRGTVVDQQGVRGTFAVAEDGTSRVMTEPRVERTRLADGREQLKILAPPEKAQEILEGLKGRAAREGKTLRVAESERRTLKNPVVQDTARLNVVELARDLARPLLKITYELGVHWLGRAYATHMTALPIAEAVRSGAIGSIEGTYGVGIPNPPFSDWAIPSWFHASTLTVVKDGGIWLAVRIFNVIEGRFLIVDAARDFPAAGDRWVILDSRTGAVSEGTGASPPTVPGEADTGIEVERVEQPSCITIRVRLKGQRTGQLEMLG